MTVHWTQAALADLRAVQAYIARHSKRYARATIARILAKAGRLERFPLLGSIVEEYRDETLRELLEGSYRIFYRVLEQQVDIVAVILASRRLPRNL